jgi:hypothetical protein
MHPDTDTIAKNRYVKFQKPKLQIDVSGDCVTIRSDVPVKGATLENDGVTFDSNFFDVVPEETISIKGRGLQLDHKVDIRYYVPSRHE